MSRTSRSPQRVLPHYSANAFCDEKRKHLATICNSPARHSTRLSHPYEENQPQAPHYSQEMFESEKRVHRTEIRASPQRSTRSLSPAKWQCEHVGMPGPPYHKSQRELAIEKVEHMTPILPEKAASRPEPRSPEHFRHKSYNQLANEIGLCKTPIYPVTQQESRKGVVDNYLNYTPHPDDYKHTSYKDMNKEKKGHLTGIHNHVPARTGATKRSASPADCGLQTSNQTLNRMKHRHSTGMHSSNRRSKSSDHVRDMSPLYESVARLKHDITRHRADMSGSPARKQLPSTGYNSHFAYSDEKRRHAVSVSPQHSRKQLASVKLHDEHCGHVSNCTFSAEKRKHVTDMHNSPRRTEPAVSQQRSHSANYTSRQELARAKRGHHISVGGGSPGVLQGKQPVYQSNECFTSEKRRHRADIGNVNPVSPPPATPPNSSFRSQARFAESKKTHRAEVNTFSRKSASPGMPSPSPQRLVSHALLRSEKAKHSMIMDSPQRQLPDVPLTPPSLDRASLERHSQQGGSVRTPSRASMDRMSQGRYSAASRSRSYTPSEISYGRSTEPRQ